LANEASDNFDFTEDTVAAAAGDLSAVGAAVGDVSAVAAAAGAPEVSAAGAGADEVSAAIANLFGSHASEYQAISAQAAAIHEIFVDTLNASAGSYAATEAANTAAPVGFHDASDPLGYL
jgi:hypothetical protein